MAKITSRATSRERLIDAAVEAFAERGFHATTTRDIAARAGMSPAALYVHHASKEDVLYEVSRLGHAGALDVVRNAVEATGS
ncbi:MAG: TetR/AcrR family transcriptional regulator, partial [Actinomycetia bacterium]|nr:TetR/AcrR family transcriptional regulator [Actinomycetes bacterium]